jgi:hypothetical protein
LCKRACPDFHTTVAFLSTRIIKMDYDDHQISSIVMKHLQEAKDMYLNLEATNIGKIINWWIDASYATQPDMFNDTGGVMMIGKGALYTITTRQKLYRRGGPWSG